MPLIPNTMNPSTNTGSAESWTSLLMGKKLGSKNDETSFAKSDLPKNHRVVEADGGMMTMDHVADRINVHVDKDGTVRKVTQG